MLFDSDLASRKARRTRHQILRPDAGFGQCVEERDDSQVGGGVLVEGREPEDKALHGRMVDEAPLSDAHPWRGHPPPVGAEVPDWRNLTGA